MKQMVEERADGLGQPSADVPEFRRTLTAPKIALLVVAAAAPLGAMIGNVPVGMILDNGAGLPALFLVAGVLIALLATGYLAMSRDIPSADGFADLVSAELGRYSGKATAFVAMIAYGAGTLSLSVGTGYFSSLILSEWIDLPWWVWSSVAVVLVAFLGQRGADLSSRVLVVFMIAEFAVLAVVDVAILAKHGFSALPLSSFSLSQIFSGNIGPGLMIAFTSFIGIESAILYTKEAKRPAYAVPRATYGAVGIITVFYVLTVWLFIGSAGGGEQAVASATELEGDFVFAVTGGNAGSAILTILQIFFCTSLLACTLALHNASVRYIHTLATDGSLPRGLSQLHARHNGPYRASIAVTVITVIVLACCAFSGADPYIGLASSLTGLFTVGIVGLQAIVAVATVVYFRKQKDTRMWTTLVAPGIGGVGIIAAVVLIVMNYSVLTGSTSPIANSLPVLILIAAIVGVSVEIWQRRSRKLTLEENTL